MVAASSWASSTTSPHRLLLLFSFFLFLTNHLVADLSSSPFLFFSHKSFGSISFFFLFLFGQNRTELELFWPESEIKKKKKGFTSDVRAAASTAARRSVRVRRRCSTPRAAPVLPSLHPMQTIDPNPTHTFKPTTCLQKRVPLTPCRHSHLPNMAWLEVSNIHSPTLWFSIGAQTIFRYTRKNLNSSLTPHPQFFFCNLRCHKCQDSKQREISR